MRRPALRETFFLAWSAAHRRARLVGPITDGGASSPLTAGLFLPLAFAALSYPLGLDARGRRDGRRRLPRHRRCGMGGVDDARGLLRDPRAGLRDLDVRLAGAQPRPAAQRARPRLAHGPADRVPEPPRLRGALRRRAQPRRSARAALLGDRPARPRRLQARQRRARARRRRRAAALGRRRRWAPSCARRTPSAAWAATSSPCSSPGAGPAEATLLAERLRAALADRAPVSFGVVELPADGLDARRPAPARRPRPLRGQARPRTEAPGAGTRELSWAPPLARAVDVRMAAAHEHSGAVADLAARIGARPRLGRRARWPACAWRRMLHDVGKIAVPEAILRKPEPLTADEMALVRTHADAGAEHRRRGSRASRTIAAVDPPLPRARRRLRLPGRPARRGHPARVARSCSSPTPSTP